MSAELPLTGNALQVLEHRYLLRDTKGRVLEMPVQLFRRVAMAVAAAEQPYGGREAAAEWGGVFFRMMAGLEFLPNSPTLMNAGRPNGQLSACFVLPVNDSLDSIFTTLRHAALIHQSGGGTGFNFSRLRPAGDPIATTGGTSSGPVSFLRIFDAATEHIKQGGKRRGANMGILNIDHPDIEAFICAKAGEGALRNFNLSVGMTDMFMRTVEKGGQWRLVNPRNGEAVRDVPARQLWEEIVRQAWLSGDPGLLFFDTVNRTNPTPALGRLTCTNPCGEMPLLDFESCNLGSINLSRMVRTADNTATLDWERLGQTVRRAIRFLDNVIDVNYYLLPEIAAITRANRKIGLGVMGWAELLIRLGIPYASAEAVALAARLMAFIREQSRETSAALAREKGTFPNWPQSIFYPDQPLRNATCTSIAPTGSISIIAGTSSSIEPLFALAYRRFGVLDEQQLTEVNPFFLNTLNALGLDTPENIRQVYESGSAATLKGLPPGQKALFRTSLEIPFSFHLQHQVAFQQYTDNAVSKTINLPATATPNDVADAFRTAWQTGAKGITVYRYGSRKGQVLQTGCKVGRPATELAGGHQE